MLINRYRIVLIPTPRSSHSTAQALNSVSNPSGWTLPSPSSLSQMGRTPAAFFFQASTARDGGGKTAAGNEGDKSKSLPYWRHILKKRTLTTALIAPLLALLPMAVPASADTSTDPHQILDAPASQLSNSEEWSNERLLAATLIDAEIAPGTSTMPAQPQARLLEAEPEPITIVEPTDPVGEQPRIRVNGAMVPTSVGKLFSVKPNGVDYSCTASIVTSGSKNIIYTAAHCVYNKDTENYGDEGWHSNFLFIPAYHEKRINGERVAQAPFGEWPVSEASVFHGWTVDHDRAFDQAFMALDSSGEHRLQDTTGANGLTYNEPKSQLFINVWGYPVLDEYENQTWRPHVCSNGMWSSSAAVPNGVRMMCDMTGGSSGGPWMKSRPTANYGYIIGVTSARPSNEQNYVHGAPNNENTKTLYEHEEARTP